MQRDDLKSLLSCLHCGSPPRLQADGRPARVRRTWGWTGAARRNRALQGELEVAYHAGRAANLTRREHEAAWLLARGLSNRRLAQELVITEKTAKNHVYHVLDKLGMHSRAGVLCRFL